MSTPVHNVIYLDDNLKEEITYQFRSQKSQLNVI